MNSLFDFCAVSFFDLSGCRYPPTRNVHSNRLDIILAHYFPAQLTLDESIINQYTQEQSSNFVPYLQNEWLIELWWTICNNCNRISFLVIWRRMCALLWFSTDFVFIWMHSHREDRRKEGSRALMSKERIENAGNQSKCGWMQLWREIKFVSVDFAADESCKNQRCKYNITFKLGFFLYY